VNLAVLLHIQEAAWYQSAHRVEDAQAVDAVTAVKLVKILIKKADLKKPAFLLLI
jgi:hypothetical protein